MWHKLLFTTYYSLTWVLRLSKQRINVHCFVSSYTANVFFPRSNGMAAFWKTIQGLKPGVQSYLRLPFALTGPPGVFVWAPFCRLGNQNTCWKVTCSSKLSSRQWHVTQLCNVILHLALKAFNLMDPCLHCKQLNKWGSEFKLKDEETVWKLGGISMSMALASLFLVEYSFASSH